MEIEDLLDDIRECCEESAMQSEYYKRVIMLLEEIEDILEN